MSLFKVRDFWTVDLDQLNEQYESLAPISSGRQQTSDTCKNARAAAAAASADDPDDGEETAASASSFVVSPGKFHSISKHSVLVCANLNGFICVIQVPEGKQPKNNNITSRPDINNGDEDEDGETRKQFGPDDSIVQRQLLCASYLGLPIVDVKCGHFTSALKQSIAVLSFDKLIVYQVKRRQADLITAEPLARLPITDQSNTGADFGMLAGGQVLDESLFSHKLEEHHRIYLIDHELASNIIMPANSGQNHYSAAAGDATDEPSSHHHHHNHHHDSSAQQDSGGGGGGTRTKSSSSSSSSSSSRNRNKHLIHGKQQQQPQLPQRDLIIVQYNNQFLFTLIDHKKVVGHFSLEDGDSMMAVQDNNDSASANAMGNSRSDSGGGGGGSLSHLEQLGQFMGPMPMVFARNSRGLLLLILATSDNRLHCLQMAKLVALAKQSVMKRVAKDLLKHSVTEEPPAPPGEVSYDNHRASVVEITTQSSGATAAVRITIDLRSMAEWALELAYSPIQMDFIQRLLSAHKAHLNTTTTIANSNETLYADMASQLLVMSRYYMDLFTTSGQHLWSQRFENPIICMTPYTILAPPPPASGETAAGSSELVAHVQGQGDRLLSLVCTDCLSNDKCNLLVVDEDRIAWSALLAIKPQQLWRTNLSKVSGAIVSLDSNKGQLSMSYLGTNMDYQDSGQLELEAASAGLEGCQLDQLDQLDKFPGTLNDLTMNLDGNNSSLSDRRRGFCQLEVDVCLEATNQWPDVQVNSCIKIRPEANSTLVIQNIVATLEFDDLIHYESSSSDIPVQTLSKSVIQVQLGSCWPDRREPISFTGRFFMHPSAGNHHHLGDMDATNAQQVRNENLMPKSLKVKLYLRFNILHSGSLLQEESFMLPLNMVARLAHIDYSTGQGQTLNDILANLNLYKRPMSEAGGGLFCPFGDHDDVDSKSKSNSKLPYYLCDLFSTDAGDLIEIADDIIESDLVCRGFNSETKGNSSLLRSAQERRERDMGTLENINLLAQSLDCRLKYRSLAHSSSASAGRNVARQSSEEYLPAVMISIALKVPSGAHLMQGLLPETESMTAGSDQPGYAIVWLHLCDLSPPQNNISQEFVKLHAREWKAFEYGDGGDSNASSANSKLNHPILISIECDHTIPILFVKAHILERLLKKSKSSGCRNKQIHGLSESMHGAIKINCNGIVKLGNFLAISTNLYDCLRSFLANYDSNFRDRFQRLKDELAKEYCKFHISTMTSLSLSKQLINLPDDMQQQFSSLSMLTKQYQLNLIRILSELERLKQADYLYSKIPESSYIVPNQDGQRDPFSWPNFVQIID